MMVKQWGLETPLSLLLAPPSIQGHTAWQPLSHPPHAVIPKEQQTPGTPRPSDFPGTITFL